MVYWFGTGFCASIAHLIGRIPDNYIKLHLENVTDRNISILAENHGYLVKKFNEAVEAAHNNHVNTVQTSYLIEHVANLENRMQAVEKNMTL